MDSKEALEAHYKVWLKQGENVLEKRNLWLQPLSGSLF